MTDPAPADFAPVWLSPQDVSDWLRQHGGDPADDVLVRRVSAAVEPQVQAARPDCWAPLLVNPLTGGATYVPDAEVYQGAVMLAAREVRRRNSPGGLENFGETTTYVSRYDPEIQRALRQGPWQTLAVG